MLGEPDIPRTPIGVMIVDDQEVFRRSAGEVVEATPGFALVGEAASGEDALALAATLSPDLILLDVRMPGVDGFETTRRLRSAHPATTVVLISSSEVDESARKSCGAAAFLPKCQFRRAALRQLWDEHS